MKCGIEYFPLDVYLDDKWKLIEAEFGLTGFAVVVKLLQKIYGEQGYYCEWTNEVALLFRREAGLGGNEVSEIVSAAVKRGIFSQTLYDKYRILTSKGIQKRYFEAVSRRKKVEAKKEYLLVQVDLLYKNVSIIKENVNIFNDNADISKQSKVEESRVKESRVEESKASEAAAPAILYDSVFQTAVQAYENNIGAITPVIAEHLQAGINDTCVDAVLYAIEQAAISDKRNMGYINAILRGLKNAGVKDRLGLETYRKSWQKNKGQAGGKPPNPALQYGQRDGQYADNQLFDNMRGEGK